MHMADALIVPAAGGAFWAVSAGLIARSARKVQQSPRDDIVPMMGVMGAFVFAAQMINFSIPGTGSSGHLGGGLMLTMLLGPHAAFLVMASVLAIQALFFADGGLLALGCNMFNLGFFPAFVAYPLFRKHLAGARSNDFIVLAAVAGLLMGALAVVAQTVLSGITEIPAGAFTLMMLPIHVAIGLVEGLATVAVVAFVRKARPEILNGAGVQDEHLWSGRASASGAGGRAASPKTRLAPVLMALAIAAALLGGVISWWASSHPDGLEWSIAQAAGTEEIKGASSAVHDQLAVVQEKTAFLPDYGFAGGDPSSANTGTSVSGLVGGLITFLVIGLAGFIMKKTAPVRT